MKQHWIAQRYKYDEVRFNKSSPREYSFTNYPKGYYEFNRVQLPSLWRFFE